MLDWDDLRSFLAITRHGNLSAAARALRVTQTTMGRRLESLHLRAGARLLLKTPRGYVLTPAGERVLANVERMEAEVLAVERSIGGDDARIAGEVRITTVETFGARVLTPMLKPLMDSHPDLAIEMITDTRALSLSRREADLALRLARFEQHETVVRQLADIAFGLFASRAYLEQRGRPDLVVGSPGHHLVALQADLALLPEALRLAHLGRAASVALRANSRDVHLEAVRAGWGIGVLPCYLAAETNELVELVMPEGRLLRGVWLGVHRDSRHTPRIRLLMDHLAAALSQARERLNPPEPST